MSDTKNRPASGKRRAARVIKIAPVTLAVRAALAVSASTFAFAASAAGHVAHPPVATFATQHQAIPAFAPIQPVVDLTTVHAARQPNSVLDMPVATAQSAGITAAGDFAAPEVESFGAVQDLLAVDPLTPGPGGISGADDSIGRNVNVPGGIFGLNNSTDYAVTSTSGIADGIFASGSGIKYLNNGATIDATGYTWAAGIEAEATTKYARNIGNTSTGAITATATGDGGQAWGIYAVAATDASVFNDGSIDVSATGAGGSATGLFDYSIGSTAVASNNATGSITVNASGPYGQATGIYAAASGDATAINSGSVNVQAYGPGGTATGVSAYSITGNASASNSSTIIVGAYGDATGLAGVAATGDAIVTNTGGIDVYSVVGTAIGMSGYAAAGDVTITNTGGIDVYSYYSVADGIFASGTNVSVSNGGGIDATGYYWAAGIEAQGDDLTTVSNTGGITVTDYAGPGPNTYGAYGIFAAGAEVSVSNTGGIAAYGFSATGVNVVAGAVGGAVTNAGGISAYGAYATGINVVSGGAVSVTNTGGITAGDDTSYLATGIRATSSYAGADVVVQNDGGITATSIYGSYGIDVSALGEGSSASVNNTGDITASVDSPFVYGAYGIVASADYNAAIDNSGTITVTSGAGGYGAMALAFNGTASVDNSNLIDVTGYVAKGAVASSANGAASVGNSGAIGVNGTYIGMGIQATGKTGATVTNSGDITVGAGYAYGVYANGGNGDVSVTLTDTSNIDVSAYFGLGVFGFSTYGDVGLDNAGAIRSQAYGQSVGLFARSTHGSIATTNSGYAMAYSYAGEAVGSFARADEGDVSVDNSGLIAGISNYGNGTGIRASGLTTEVTNDGGAYGIALHTGTATGIDVYGGDSATVTNEADAGAMSKYGSARGIYAASGGDVSVSNGADAVIHAEAPNGGAWGVIAYSVGGNANVDNAGQMYVDAQYNATGIYAGGPSATVTNSGSIEVYSIADRAIGIFGYSADGSIDITNTGTITVESAGGLADGIFASGATVDVHNSGTIDATGYAWAAGIEAQGGDLVTVDNSGTINANSDYGSAYGLYATSGAGGATVGNSGSITVMGYYATGIDVRSEGGISITNTGNITAGSADYSALGTGIHASNNYENSDITVINGGDISVAGYYGATGIDVAATGAGSSATVSNTGTIYANHGSKYGYGAAGIVVSADNDATADNAGAITTVSALGSYGAAALAFSGDANVVNSGDIDVTSTAMKYYSAVGMLSASSAGAAFADNSGHVNVTSDKYIGTGIQVTGNTGATATNSGSITVQAKYAYGIVATAGHGDVVVGNGADGSVYAYSGINLAVGLLGVSTVGDVSIDNAGDVSAVSYGAAYGVFANAKDGNAGVTNSGSLYAYSYGDQANGAFAMASNGDVSIQNSGTVEAAGYYGNAVGLYGIDATATARIGNTGHVAATAYHDATGARALSYGGVASIDNAGIIDATTTYAGGTAAGVYANGYAGTQVTNSGTINAVSASGSDAIGVIARGDNAVLVDNSGLITATDDDYAVGVSLDSTTGVATLVNSGVIRTHSTLEGEVAVSGADGVQHVLNYGDIYGAAITAGGDDAFTNGAGGTWHVTNHSTDFGDGDDSIHNLLGGTIELAFHGAIHLGASGSGGNAFINEGVLRVKGRGLVDMGTSGSASNLLPLENNGIIDFVDGAGNDRLTIAGDLGGTGAVNLDLAPLTGTADQLYVDGNVASPQTVNVSLAGAPLSAHIDPVVFAHVTGDSTSGSFVGGTLVGFDASSFLDLDVSISSQIDTSNATSDVFSIGLDVAGLNDAGSLAASVASSAQSIINTQVGTYRQRMGVMPEKRSDMAGLGPWLRYFSDSGTVKASHVADNFGGTGTFSFDQTTTGHELGMNVAFDNGFNTGVLLAKAQGAEHLTGTGVGSDHIDSTAFGVYGTWFSHNGFYVDASYRWLDFDAHLKSPGGFQSTSGNGEAFNVEAGYAAWNWAGIAITPQLQYTHSKVDGFRAIHGSSVDFLAAGGDSSRGRAGVEFSKVINGGGWIWTPYGSVNAVREFDGESRYTVADTFTGATSIEGTSGMIELGMGAQKNGFSATAGASWTDGGAMQSFLGGQLILRYSW
ncbi:MAG: hypothetical protein ACJ8GK_03230 [Luteimonas sp.]